MNSTIHFKLPGYGLGQSGQQVTSAVGGTLLTAAPFAGPAAPFVAIAGGITELLGAIGIGKGCGQTCITASNYANQAETLLKQNLSAYMALATPRAQSAQQAALNNFTQIWNGLVTACAGVPGDAGKNCVQDRQAGSCKWKDANGQCWNWFIGYHDPIANDPQTYNDSVSAVTGGAGGTGIASAVGGTSSILWIGAAVLAGLFLVSRI